MHTRLGALVMAAHLSERVGLTGATIGREENKTKKKPRPRNKRGVGDPPQVFGQ